MLSRPERIEKLAARLTISPGRLDQSATGGLKRMKLKARNQGDLNSAVISAGYYAKKIGQTMYVYSGSSYMHRVWRVSMKPSEYLDPINNTGTRMLSVTPELEVYTHEVKGPMRPTAQRISNLTSEVQEITKLASHRKTSGMKVRVVGFVSGQEPDDMDDDWAADMEVEGHIEGREVAQLLEKQQRVLEGALKKLDQKKALSLITDGRNKTSKDLLRLIERDVKREVAVYAMDEFSKGARIDTVDFLDNTQYWSAKIDPRRSRIDFEIEVGVSGRWT